MIEPLRTIGVLAALPAELGPLRGAAEVRLGRLGVRIARHGVAGRGSAGRGGAMREAARQRAAEAGSGPVVVSALSGVGKVRGALAAAALVAEGVEAVLVVGTAGALDGGREVGDLLLASEAVQWDLAGREGRRIEADAGLLEAWRASVPEAALAPFLTSDRPALGWLQRGRRLRAARRALGGGPAPVADMETAAVAHVCARAGVPWAALRVISDRPFRLPEVLGRERRARTSFQHNFERVAGAPAETLDGLIGRLGMLPAEERRGSGGRGAGRADG